MAGLRRRRGRRPRLGAGPLPRGHGACRCSSPPSSPSGSRSPSGRTASSRGGAARTSSGTPASPTCPRSTSSATSTPGSRRSSAAVAPAPTTRSSPARSWRSLGGLVPDGSFLDQTRWYFALWALLGRAARRRRRRAHRGLPPAPRRRRGPGGAQPGAAPRRSRLLRPLRGGAGQRRPVGLEPPPAGRRRRPPRAGGDRAHVPPARAPGPAPARPCAPAAPWRWAARWRAPPAPWPSSCCPSSWPTPAPSCARMPRGGRPGPGSARRGWSRSWSDTALPPGATTLLAARGAGRRRASRACCSPWAPTGARRWPRWPSCSWRSPCVTGKSFPVQASLWLVPLVALCGVRWRDPSSGPAPRRCTSSRSGSTSPACPRPDRGLPPGWYGVFLGLRVLAVLPPRLAGLAHGRPRAAALAGPRGGRRRRARRGPRRGPRPAARAPRLTSPARQAPCG